MQLKSLGLIETQGLTAGIEAADAAVKSANVQLVGYELTKGGGWTTVKVMGDVGAVKEAVDAARIAASKVNRVVSTKVIPRPSAYLASLIHSPDTVGDEEKPEPPKGPPTPPKSPKPAAPTGGGEVAPEKKKAEGRAPEKAKAAEETVKETPLPEKEEDTKAEKPAAPATEKEKPLTAKPAGKPAPAAAKVPEGKKPEPGKGHASPPKGGVPARSAPKAPEVPKPPREK